MNQSILDLKLPDVVTANIVITTRLTIAQVNCTAGVICWDVSSDGDVDNIHLGKDAPAPWVLSDNDLYIDSVKVGTINESALKQYSTEIGENLNPTLGNVVLENCKQNRALEDLYGGTCAVLSFSKALAELYVKDARTAAVIDAMFIEYSKRGTPSYPLEAMLDNYLTAARVAVDNEVGNLLAMMAACMLVMADLHDVSYIIKSKAVEKGSPIKTITPSDITIYYSNGTSTLVTVPVIYYNDNYNM